MTIDEPHIVIEHPQWAHRTTITMICGAPGSGKTTLGRKLHRNILDMDDFPPGEPRERMRRYGKLAWKAGRVNAPHLAVIRCAASNDERRHLEGLCQPHRTIVLLTPPDVCRQRVIERNRNDIDGRDVAAQCQAIDDWWATWSLQ